MNNERLYTLDAMRGVAAIVVAAYHLLNINLRFVPSGYMAVDFFFILSGVVITMAYDNRFDAGLSVISFFHHRIVRLYPMFLIGYIVIFLKLSVKIIIFHSDYNYISIIDTYTSALFNLFMLPSPLSSNELFPLNPPAWSIFFEVFINIVYACFLQRIKPKSLLPYIAISLSALLICVFTFKSSNIGWRSDDIYGGFARVGFSFITGIAIYRTGIFQARRQRFFFVAPVVILICALFYSPALHNRPYYDILFAVIISPLLVLIGGLNSPPPSARKICEILGDISFPLYMIHVPLMFLAEASQKIAGNVGVFVYFALQVALAYYLGRFVDPLLRRAMTSVLPSRHKHVLANRSDAPPTGMT